MYVSIYSVLIACDVCCLADRVFLFFQAEDGIRDAQESRGLGDVDKRQEQGPSRQQGGRQQRPDCAAQRRHRHGSIPREARLRKAHSSVSVTKDSRAGPELRTRPRRR